MLRSSRAPRRFGGLHLYCLCTGSLTLQAALDYCKATCGTVVVDKPGSYLTGALSLTGCIHLELPAGVTLLAGAQVQLRRAYRRVAQRAHKARL